MYGLRLVSMSELRQRIPYSARNLESWTSNEIVALEEFETIEEVAVALESSGIGAPVGAFVGLLGIIGFGVYEIYNYFKETESFDSIKNIVEDSTKNIYEGKSITGLNPPPFKYLGPGNTIGANSGINFIDDDAKEHDIKYDQANSFNDIKKADLDFINKAGDHLVEPTDTLNSLGSLIGGVGIGVKTGVEHLLNKQLYPTGKMAPPTLHRKTVKNDRINTSTNVGSKPVKRPSQQEINEATPVKVPAVSEISSPGQSTSISQSIDVPSADIQEDVEMTSLPGTGKPQGSTSGDGTRNALLYKVPSPKSNFGHRITTYKKVHRFLTYGLAHRCITQDINTPLPQELRKFWTTSMAQVPWEYPFLYMNPSEFTLLQPGSYVKELRVKIIYRRTRVAFETGSTSTALATLNQITNVRCGFGLNLTGWGTDFSFSTFQAGNPMVPTAITAPKYSDYAEHLYGVNNDVMTAASDTAHHQFGIPMQLRNYFCLPTTNLMRGGIPALIEKIEEYDGATIEMQTLGQFQYTPKMGMIRPVHRHNRWALPDGYHNQNDGNIGLHIPVNGAYGAGITHGFQTTLANQGISNNITLSTISQTAHNPIYAGRTLSTQDDVFSENWFKYESRIEKSQFLRQGPWGQVDDAQLQPSIHIGIAPVPSLSTNTFTGVISDWTDTQAWFDVVCEMDVEDVQPTAFPKLGHANVPAGDQIYSTCPAPPEFASVPFAGLQPTQNIRNLPAATRTKTSNDMPITLEQQKVLDITKDKDTTVATYRTAYNNKSSNLETLKERISKSACKNNIVID